MREKRDYDVPIPDKEKVILEADIIKERRAE